jgi:potassium/chloride transporter 4/5/6
MQPAAGDPLLQPSGQDSSGDGGESGTAAGDAGSRPASTLSGQKSKEYDQNLLLYTDEEDDKRPTTASFLSRIADLNSLPPTMDAKADFSAPQKRGADLGTLTGVYLPCIQNIFGVILFIRMVWIVGTAGVPLAFIVVLICCMVTFATSISLSAIATNGIVPAGGAYFMISRALGPEFGGAVGVLFFLATGVAGAMYITGAVEIVLNYMSPEMALFGDFRADPNILYHNIRIYGTCLLLLCAICVYIGVKFVSKVAPIALVCVLLSILSIYGGIFINYEGTDDTFCTLGERIMACPVEHCTKNQSDPESLYNLFCTLKVPAGSSSSSSSLNSSVTIALNNPRNKGYSDPIGSASSSSFKPQYECDQYFLDNEPIIRKAIPGLASGVLSENIAPRFGKKGDLITYGDPTYDSSKPKYANILIDITSSFTFFVAIYFPSCTGILAGSNRSGDLKDGQRSIPTGTLAAQLTTSFVYLSSVVLFGAAFNNLFIRDKFGECAVSTFFLTFSQSSPSLSLLFQLLRKHTSHQ